MFYRFILDMLRSKFELVSSSSFLCNREPERSCCPRPAEPFSTPPSCRCPRATMEELHVSWTSICTFKSFIAELMCFLCSLSHPSRGSLLYWSQHALQGEDPQLTDPDEGERSPNKLLKTRKQVLPCSCNHSSLNGGLLKRKLQSKFLSEYFILFKSELD